MGIDFYSLANLMMDGGLSSTLKGINKSEWSKFFPAFSPCNQPCDSLDCERCHSAEEQIFHFEVPAEVSIPDSPVSLILEGQINDIHLSKIEFERSTLPISTRTLTIHGFANGKAYIENIHWNPAENSEKYFCVCTQVRADKSQLTTRDVLMERVELWAEFFPPEIISQIVAYLGLTDEARTSIFQEFDSPIFDLKVEVRENLRDTLESTSFFRTSLSQVDGFPTFQIHGAGDLAGVLLYDPFKNVLIKKGEKGENDTVFPFWELNELLKKLSFDQEKIEKVMAHFFQTTQSKFSLMQAIGGRLSNQDASTEKKIDRLPILPTSVLMDRTENHQVEKDHLPSNDPHKNLTCIKLCQSQGGGGHFLELYYDNNARREVRLLSYHPMGDYFQEFDHKSAVTLSLESVLNRLEAWKEFLSPKDFGLIQEHLFLTPGAKENLDLALKEGLHEVVKANSMPEIVSSKASQNVPVIKVKPHPSASKFESKTQPYLRRVIGWAEGVRTTLMGVFG